MLASASVLSAIRHAVREVRAGMGVHDHFDLNAPATPDEVQRLCALEWTRYSVKDEA